MQQAGPEKESFCLTQRLQHVATSKTAPTRATRRHTTTKAWRDGHIKDGTRHSPDLKNSRFIGFPLFPFLPLGVSLLPDWFWCKKVYPLVPERILIVPQKSLLFEPEESRCGRRTFFLCKSLLLDAGVYS